NLILALVDQRPSRISDEVRSQLANRLVMSLKEPSDVEAALAGVPDKKMWENIIAKLPLRTVAVIGDAIRIPTVIDVLSYDDLNVREHVLGTGILDEWTVRESPNARTMCSVAGSGPNRVRRTRCLFIVRAESTRNGCAPWDRHLTRGPLPPWGDPDPDGPRPRILGARSVGHRDVPHRGPARQPH